MNNTQNTTPPPPDEKRRNRLAWLAFGLFIFVLVAGVLATIYLLLIAGR